MIKTSTIIRTVALFAVLVNQVLAIFGKNLPLNDNMTYQVVSAVLTVAVAAYVGWKNNDFTKFARAAGSVFDALKDGKMTVEEVENIVKAFSRAADVENDDNAEVDNDNSAVKNENSNVEEDSDVNAVTPDKTEK